MARTSITPVTLTRNQATVTTAMLVAIDATNGMKVKYEEQDQLVIVVQGMTGQGAAAKDITFKASTSKYAYMKGQGDLTTEIAASAEAMFAGLEQWRFKQDDGYVYIDFEAGFTGKIGAFIAL